MKLENINTSDLFTFTFNPCNRYQFLGKPGRTVKCIEFMAQIIKTHLEYWCHVEYLYPEYSFNHQSSCMSDGPRLHWHGAIRFTDIFYFLELGYFSLMPLGKFEITQIKDEGWLEYCTKNKDLMGPICSRLSKPYRLKTKRLPIKPPQPLIEEGEDPLDL